MHGLRRAERGINKQGKNTEGNKNSKCVLNANGKQATAGQEAKDPHQEEEDVEEDTKKNKQQKNRKHKKQDKVMALTYVVEWLMLTSSGEGA